MNLFILFFIRVNLKQGLTNYGWWVLQSLPGPRPCSFTYTLSGCLVLQRQFSFAETTGSENVKYLLSGLLWEKFAKAYVKPLIWCFLVVGAPCPWLLSSPTPSSLSVSLMQH